MRAPLLNRMLRVLLGLCLMGLGLWLLPAPSRPLRFPPSSQDLLRLTGPLRILPVPFAWQAFSRASRQQDEALTLTRGRWLLSLMPEAEGLYTGMAWRLAYNLAAMEKEPQGRARRVREALILLDEGMRQRPELMDLPALAGYILQNKSQGQGMVAALETALGEDPYLKASRYLERAAQIGELSGGQRFVLMLLSMRLVELGERSFGAQVLETLAEQEPPDGKPVGMSRHLRALADALRAKGPLRLSPELCQWLRKTEPFGRKPELWPCR